jgi:hypothetical protein
VPALAKINIPNMQIIPVLLYYKNLDAFEFITSGFNFRPACIIKIFDKTHKNLIATLLKLLAQA